VSIRSPHHDDRRRSCIIVRLRAARHIVDAVAPLFAFALLVMSSTQLHRYSPSRCSSLLVAHSMCTTVLIVDTSCIAVTPFGLMLAAVLITKLDPIIKPSSAAAPSSPVRQLHHQAQVRLLRHPLYEFGCCAIKLYFNGSTICIAVAACTCVRLHRGIPWLHARRRNDLRQPCSSSTPAVPP
jgi:hypothetical protein